MDTREALAVLGLSPGSDLTQVRAAYLRLLRRHHPDVAGAGATPQAARLTEAYAVLRHVARAGDGSTITVPEPPPPGPPPGPPPQPARPADAGFAAYEEAVEAELAAGDTLLIDAPPPEAYAALFEAAGRVGHVAYFDRQLGIIETIVRFEGGPSCSLLITLQGRAFGTEAFCTLESIEADPTPPIGPVVEALVDALRARPA